jgi:hypothetical protein
MSSFTEVRTNFLQLLEAIRVELSIAENIYSTLFKVLKENPHYAIRNGLEDATVNTKKVLSFSVECLFPDEPQHSAILEFKQQYKEFIEGKRSCFASITDLTNKIYVLLGIIEQLNGIINLIQTHITDE